MSDIKMPEPTAWISVVKCVGPEYGKEHFGKLPIQSLQPGYYAHTPLITTAQAEAYKDACVREALEEAIDQVAFHGGSVEIEAAIRALIPSTPA